MSKKNEFVEYIVEDVLNFLDDLSVKRLFDGYGIYRNGKIFAMVHDDTLYFKTSDNKGDLIRNLDGSHQFTYFRNGQEIGLSYWSIPEDILEDTDIIMKILDSIGS